MNAEELVAKINEECKYTGSSKVEGYIYYRGVEDVIKIINRELPHAPIPEPVPVPPVRKSKGKSEDD